MSKQRITILLGAGAVFEATRLSTSSITRRVIKECKRYKIAPDKSQSVVDYICKFYWERFGKNDPNYKVYSKANLNVITNYVNFEDIFHVLELLAGYTLDSSVKRYTSAYKVFTKFKNRFSDIDYLSIISSANKMINVINDIIAEYCEQFDEKSGYFKDFLQELEKEYTLNIFNLNYDTWCEQSLKSYEDGFRLVSGYDKLQRFSIDDYRKACEKGKNTIAHLHGSVLMGDADFKRGEVNRFAYTDDQECLYKYLDYNAASGYRLRSAKSNSANQAGESLIRANIITGLMKTDKLLWNPLMEYEHHFYKALTSNDKLLIVGYGFLDKYVNSMLWRYQCENFDQRKVLLITKANENDWQPMIEPPFSPPEMTIFTELMFKDQAWFCKVKFDQVEGGYYSDDGMAGLYTCGLKTVVEKYMDHVVRFYK
ncbi:SIR2 family protein [Butyrivibrio sp. AD3002]|uniref:SIR2 family protein n=1 Tax=Butyrivibrio sp. AD3002 TaxID=1280670 RepID=UPI0003B74975|nr:SIR2 family protein [Butyrivibrio sp. AD3002]